MKSNSVGSGNMSYCRASSFYNHLDHCFVVSKHIQQSFWWEELTFEGKKTKSVQIIDHSMRLLSFLNCGRCWTNIIFVHQQSLRSWLLWYVFPWRTATIRSQKSRAGIPSNLNPASKEMISDSVELCETEVCFLHIQLIGTNVWLPMTSKNAQCSTWSRLSPQDLLQNRSLETVPVCIVWQCLPHGNTVCIHMFDECKRSNHMLWSILWSIVQVCSLTLEYQVFQYAPSKSISEQFESMFLTILQRISIFIFEMMVMNSWNRYIVQLLSRLVCQLTISFQHISCHDFPYRRTTKKYTDFPRMVIF